MSLEKAREYLKKYGLEDKIMEFPVSSATVEEAAKAINCREEEIVKTLSFIVDDKPILIAVAGDTKIDNCGSSNSAVKLSLDDLEKTSNFKKWIDVCKVI